jgi:thiamine biosynthesis lipoprotein ApbE
MYPADLGPLHSNQKKSKEHKNQNFYSKTEINQIFSTWDTQSELSVVNQQPVNEWIKVSNELFYVLKTAKEIYLADRSI